MMVDARRRQIAFAAIATVGCVTCGIYSARLKAEEQVLQPVYQVRLDNVVPRSMFAGNLEIQAATASKAGIFLLCSTQDSTSASPLRLLLRLTERGTYVSASAVDASIWTIAADDTGSVAILTMLPDKQRKASLIGPDGSETATVTHPNLSRVAVLDGHFYGLWDYGARVLFEQNAIASQVTFTAPEPLFNDTVVPLRQGRFALVRRSTASISILDANTGIIAPAVPIESPEIKFRDQTALALEGKVISNALKSVASNGEGGILVSPTGRHFPQSFVLDITDRAVVSRTVLFSMAKWDDLKSTANPGGYMQGNLLLKTDNHFVWLNQAQARLAVYD